jgi:hypothetical protein
LTKNWLGDFLGDFSWSLGDFLTKTSGHPGNHGNKLLKDKKGVSKKANN